jgi:DNA polymerase-3 subunit epsilon
MRCAGATASTTATAHKHGALLDAELLAEVYIELIGGKQAAFGLETSSAGAAGSANSQAEVVILARSEPLPPRISDAERAAHAALVKKLGEKALWLQQPSAE